MDKLHIAKSLFVVYKQLPEDAQQAFRQLLDDEAGTDRLGIDWVASLRDDWEAPENDVWDELFAKQFPNHKPNK